MNDERSGREGSFQVTDLTVIDAFNSNESNTYLVSFPRTGSHWLRMIMELYFERPSLVRVFYYPERSDYLTLHTHDMDLTVTRKDVIYLYRDPVETIYSQLNYLKESCDDPQRIVYWSDLYGKHLDKWLYRETFTRHKTILSYEGLKRDMVTEFAKVTGHFKTRIDAIRLGKIAAQITKEEVKRKTKHDQQVIKLEARYGMQREEFRVKHAWLVWETVTRNRPQLADVLKHE